jgi:phage replication initiation protein
MSWVQEEASRIKTAQKTAEIGYDYLTKYARIAYGRHINVMMEVEGDAERVVDRLRRFGTPARLTLPFPPEAYTPE